VSFVFGQHHITTQHNTTQHNTTQNNTTQNNTTQYNTLVAHYDDINPQRQGRNDV
jgi:hypothetical protein